MIHKICLFSIFCLLTLSSSAVTAADTPATAAPGSYQVIEKLPASQPRVTTSERPEDKPKPKPTSPQKDEVFEQARPSLVTQAAAISMMALFPFAVMLLSPFLKFVVVLSLLRTALGVQNSPPNMVINGVALMMALFIMYPVGGKIYEKVAPAIESVRAPDSLFSADSPAFILSVANAASGPIKDFLKDNSLVKHQRVFYRMVYRNTPESLRSSITPDDFIVLVPAYITGQLKEAFEIGVLIYIPFFVIDMVVSNVLLAMGMMMLSPVTISMPLKLFLLVMLDGWTVLIQGLVQSFK